MSTNAMIYAKQEDDSVKGVYLHWDGYPGYAGDILLNHYTNDAKVQKLISLGNLSSLGQNPEASELVARFGFNATCYPVEGQMASYLSEEWRKLTESERKRLMDDNNRHEHTVAYARDRGDAIEFEIFPTVSALKKTSAERRYEYYWNGRTWYMRKNKVFRKLTQANCDKYKY